MNLDLLKMRREFDKLLGLEDPCSVKFPKPDEFKLWQNGIVEEMQEVCEAYNSGDILEFYDGILDLMYFHLRMFTATGLPLEGLGDVHKANMNKRLAKSASESKRSNVNDAVKPVDWTPPDLSKWVLGEKIEKPEPVSNFIPDLFYKSAVLMNTKDQDYNQGLFDKEDYFLFGKKSYIHMLYTKVLRLVSLESTERVNYESEADTCQDLINYTSFYYDFLLQDGEKKS